MDRAIELELPGALSRREFLALTAAAAAALSIPRPAFAQDAYGWKLLTDGEGPPPRWDHMLVSDDTGRQLMVFGGRDASITALGDTWLFDIKSRTWTQLDVTGPEPRFGIATAVDAKRRAVYLFGGQSADVFFNDAWTFDFASAAWSRIETTNNPSPRYGLPAVIDGSGKLLVSHGFTADGRFDDTWSLDLETGDWSDISPAPDKVRPMRRCLHEMVWDPSRARLILFGGCSSGYGPCPQGDLWSFDPDGREWVELVAEGGPSARSNPALAIDTLNNASVLVGGLTESGYVADIWNGTPADEAFAWESVAQSVPSPSPRASHDVAISGNFLYLFGGTGGAGVTNDLWRMRLPRQ